jgi:hypothetical protein
MERVISKAAYNEEGLFVCCGHACGRSCLASVFCRWSTVQQSHQESSN